MAVRAVLIGAGLRGRHVYGAYARAHPDRLRIVALAEPDPERAAATAREHGLGPERVFPDWRDLLAREPMGEAAILATPDDVHVGPALAAIERGYHVLLEKPIAPTAEECVAVVRAAERAGSILQIGHVLRFAPFYRKVHEILASGVLGELVAMDLKEHVAHWHMTHSYVRGKFRSRRRSAPLLLAKCCHDLDLLTWFAGRAAERVASFGSLAHYRPERAPAGAPARCTAGCPVQDTCVHDAERFYLGPDDGLARLWPWSDVSPDPSRAARRRALEEGPYGRCVYHCDNDVVDRQVLAVELAGGLAATFTVHGHAVHEQRTLRITGSLGELRGLLHQGRLTLLRTGSLEAQEHRFEASPLGHFGGDAGLLDHFTDVVSRGAVEEVATSGRSALEGHLLGFAAEAAREQQVGVDVAAFRAALDTPEAKRSAAPGARA